jgi:hypothetical protein
MGPASEETNNTRAQVATTKPIEADEWRTRPALALLIDNIPKHWMIGDLKNFLDGFGTVIKAEIFEDRMVSLDHVSNI